MTPIQSGPDIQNEVESFFANEEPMEFVAPWAMPSGRAVAVPVEPLRVSPLTGFHPYREERRYARR